jgi:arylsulfatase A-like enzyme
VSASRAFALALVASVMACTRSGPPVASPSPSAAPRARHVVLITIDALRADHVGARPAGIALTPSLDALALEGTTFSDCVANCTVTRSSHASMLTGLYPWRHGIPDNASLLAPGVRTLPQLLGGIATAAVVSSLPLRELAAGFGSFEMPHETPAPGMPEPLTATPGAATHAALGFVRAHRDVPWFLFVHYFPPHGPYTPPENFRDALLESPAEPPLRLSARNYEKGAIPKYQALGSARDPALYRGRYAEHLRFVDRHVGRFLQALKQEVDWDSVAVIVTADHGESLGERGWYFCHGNLTYAEQSHVPLIVKMPGGARGARVTAPVQGVDITPTVLQLLGATVPDGLDGKSLIATMAAPDTARVRLTQSNDAEQLSILSGGWKFTRLVDAPNYVEPGHPRRTLYRIDTDPGETTNLVDREPAVAEALEKDLARRFKALPSARPTDPRQEEQLRSLGYVR